MLRETEGGIVTALSGSETMEIAYALGRLVRGGVGSHSAVLAEATSNALEAFRLPLSAIAEAELVVVVGDDPVVERAPIVDLWIKEARRRGAEIVVCSPTGAMPTPPGGAPSLCRELAAPGNELGKRLRAAERAVLIWSGPGGGGGARIAELAHELGLEDKPGSGAFHLPVTPNGRGVAAAWSAASDGEETTSESIGVLVVSGDEAAADPAVRALAEQADRVLVDHDVPRARRGLGGPDPAGDRFPRARRHDHEPRGATAAAPTQRSCRRALTSSRGSRSSRAGSTSTSRRTPPSSLRSSPSASSATSRSTIWACTRRFPQGMCWVAPEAAPAAEAAPIPAATGDHFVGELHLQRYRPLLSGPAVERVKELEFQRPEREAELSYEDAERRGISSGDAVLLRSNGTSVELRARVNRRLIDGIVRVAEEHAVDLHATVEVVKA